jgi:hypothetical protein
MRWALSPTPYGVSSADILPENERGRNQWAEEAFSPDGLLPVAYIEPDKGLMPVLDPEAAAGLDGDVRGRVIADQPVIGPGLAPTLANWAGALPGCLAQ